MHSRYSQRHKKRRQDHILNGMIAVVVLLILIVGARLFWGTSAEEAETANTDPVTTEESSDEFAEEATDADEEGNSVRDDAAVGRNDDTGDNHNIENKEQSQSTEDDAAIGDHDNINEDDGEYHFSGGGPNGPWEPIGTKQTGEHVSTYEEGTIDREEKDLAVAYGAGLLEELQNDELIVWRIENGGSADRAIGRISTKADQNTMYIVTIEWVDGKGWKPTSVEIDKRNSE